MGRGRYPVGMSHISAMALLCLPTIGAAAMFTFQVIRTARRPVLALEDLMMALAWVFLVGAAFWAEAWLSDSSQLGFEAPWTWLTAAHFIVAGFGALSVSA